MKNLLSFEDVVLVPKYSRLVSRKHADTSINLIGKKFKLPVCPSNMVCTINDSLAKFMSESGYFYVMHRFCDVTEFIQKANDENWKFISASIGVGPNCWRVVEEVKKRNLRVDCLTIDVAHGHHSLVKQALEKIKNNLSGVFVIAGNVTTPEGTQDLKDWGADMVKVSIGTGKACITKDKTGFTLPIFSCIQECARVDIPIMADGGVRSHGDIAKSIVAGASISMIGSMFAACKDSPSEETVYYPTADSKNDSFFKIPKKYKKYFGSASFESKTLHNLKEENIEGKMILIEENGKTYEQLLQEIEQDLQSSISYSGGFNISHLSHTHYRVI